MAVGMLEVLLVDARELRDRHFWCGFDCLIPCLNETKAPYAQIQYGAQNQTSCLAQEEGKKRVWNEKFRFPVECVEEDDDMKNKVVLSTVEKHQFFPDFLVGKTTIYVKDVILRGMEEGKVVHGPHKYRVVRQDKTYSGEITVTVTFIKETLEPKFFNQEPRDIYLKIPIDVIYVSSFQPLRNCICQHSPSTNNYLFS